VRYNIHRSLFDFYWKYKNYKKPPNVSLPTVFFVWYMNVKPCGKLITIFILEGGALWVQEKLKDDFLYKILKRNSISLAIWNVILKHKFLLQERKGPWGWLKQRWKVDAELAKIHLGGKIFLKSFLFWRISDPYRFKFKSLVERFPKIMLILIRNITPNSVLYRCTDQDPDPGVLQNLIRSGFCSRPRFVMTKCKKN